MLTLMERELELFKHGEIYSSRHDIVNKISKSIQTGDIFLRVGDERIFGFPFTKMVARVTESEWSHGSVAIVENDEIYLAEVNDRGTLKYRLIDWLDFCKPPKFAVYRLKDRTEDEEINLEKSIKEFLKADHDYDFTFDSEKDVYCTESVHRIYRDAGIALPDPKPIKELVYPRAYYIGMPINWILTKAIGKGLTMSNPVHIVGNKQKGLLSCSRLSQVFYYDGKF